MDTSKRSAVWRNFVCFLFSSGSLDPQVNFGSFGHESNFHSSFFSALDVLLRVSFSFNLIKTLSQNIVFPK